MHSQWCESAVKSHQLLACVHRTTTVTAPVGQCGLDTGRDMHTGVPEPVVVSVVRHMRVHDRSYTEHAEERGSYVKLKVLVVALVPRSGWWTLASTCTLPRWSFAALACGCVMHAHACRCASAMVQPHGARHGNMATATTAAARRVRPTPARMQTLSVCPAHAMHAKPRVHGWQVGVTRGRAGHVVPPSLAVMHA